MAIAVARAKRTDAQREARFADGLITAAVGAIEDCGSIHASQSPVWNEVVATLGSADMALAAIEKIARQEPPSVSVEAQRYIERFARAFIAEAVDTRADSGLDTAAVLTAIGLLRVQMMGTKSPADPLHAIPWHRRPDAPKFRISPSLDKQRLNLQIELIDGNEPGDVTAAWSVNEGSEVEPQLMHQPSRTWARQAKPADCEWRVRESGNEAHLRIRFVTPDGEHGYHYRFPLIKHPKGHWMLQTHLGTGVNAPEPF